MLNFILNVIAAFIATIGFSVLFHVRPKHLFLCGVTGALGWGAYLIFTQLGYSPVFATFIGALLVSQTSYLLSKHRKAPITVFLISGIIPLVPGIGLYRTMYYLFLEQPDIALTEALLAFQMAGVIAIAILLISIIPSFKRKKIRK